MDLFFKLDSVASVTTFACHYQNSTNYWQFIRSGVSGLRFAVRVGGTDVINTGNTTIFSDTTSWHHLALVKVGSEYAVYLDGNQLSYTNDSSTANFTGDLRIGYFYSSAPFALNGHVDAFRIQKSNIFNASPDSGKTDTITVPTSAPEADADTKLLLNFGITDESDSKHLCNFVGTAQLDTAQTKFGDTSLLLDGNSDYVTVPDSDDWDFGDGDFTIDFWTKFNDVTGVQCFMSHATDINNYWYFIKSQVTGIRFVVEVSASSVINTGNTTVFTDTTSWHHIAVVRNGTNMQVYLDGVSLSSITTSVSIANQTGALQIGASSQHSYYHNGWLEELRISKGIARWTSNFTPNAYPYNNGILYEEPITIATADTWQEISLSLTDIEDADKDTITSFGIEVTDASSQTDIYLDIFDARYVGITDIDVSVNEALTGTENVTNSVIPALDIGPAGTLYDSVSIAENYNKVYSQPAQPTNTSPSGTNVALAPTLVSSAYSHPLSIAHDRSRWQIRTSAGNYDSPVYDSGWVAGAVTSHNVPAGTLNPEETYYWHVSYRDIEYAWSEWSSETSFTTKTLKISGQVTLNSVGTDGAKVYLVKQSTDTVVDTDTTAGGGYYEFTALEYGETYHLMVEYETGGTRYNALSRWDIDPVETDV